MKAPGLIAVVVCMLAVGAGSARLTAAKSSTIAVTINNLGCSTATGANSFEATAWSWGASNVSTPAPGGGGGEGKAVISALSLTRVSDACSPVLLGGVVMGKHFPTLTLTQYGDGGAVIATVVLTDVTISDWRIGGEADGVSEQVQVSFLRFTFTDVASGNKFCWDLVASKGC